MAPQSVDVKTVIITYQDKAPLTVVQPDDKTKDPTPHLTDSDLKGRSRHLQGGKIPSSVLEILANPILVEPMPNAPSRVTEQSVLVVPTPLVIRTPIAKSILANNNLVESMLNAKVQVAAPFVNVLEVLLGIHSLVVMIILAILTLVDPMLIVKMLEIGQFVGVVMDMKVISLSSLKFEFRWSFLNDLARCIQN